MMLFSLPFWGCGNRSKPETPDTAVKGAPAVPAGTQAEAKMDETLPPILRAPWKGDLDEIVKRRVVRVLLPFRRPI